MHSQNPIGALLRRSIIIIYMMLTRIKNILIATALLSLVQLAASTGVTTTTTISPTTSTTSRYANPLVEHKHERNCKALCEHCGCLGFYCGEECICECNNENSDTECIQTMQLNARTLNAPFEILIQGPSNNRFVRNALQFDQKRELVVRSASQSKSPRNRRSTITIYKPMLLSVAAKRPAFSMNALESPASLGEKKSQLERHKRSVDHLEWFNDFASTLVRPSPLGTRAQKQRAAAFKRQAATTPPLAGPHREPWFLEQAAPRLNRPAPLYRRQQQLDDDEEREREERKSRKSSRRRVSKPVSIEDDFDAAEEVRKPRPEIRPLRDALQVVERIPRVLQDTVTHLAADDNSGDVFSLNIMNDVLPTPMEPQRKEPRKVKRRLSHRSRKNEVPTTRVSTSVTRAPLVMPPAPLAPRGLLLPWLRQQRLKRLGLQQ
ncbi:uncharacterized protein LOC132794305 [Drosophila nasuta]|uniref:uncharacterized protein LOC132794305 n=1 Tax=Drosophila nasuta TaxID=42062 RepID=UPI00295EB357|nr:uncharacterized protein LOC132794305 [Drosophila nasuta]